MVRSGTLLRLRRSRLSWVGMKSVHGSSVLQMPRQNLKCESQRSYVASRELGHDPWNASIFRAKCDPPTLRDRPRVGRGPRAPRLYLTRMAAARTPIAPCRSPHPATMCCRLFSRTAKSSSVRRLPRCESARRWLGCSVSACSPRKPVPSKTARRARSVSRNQRR